MRGSWTSISTASRGCHMEVMSFIGARAPTGDRGCPIYCPHIGDECAGEKASWASSVTDFVGVGGIVPYVGDMPVFASASITRSSDSGSGLRRGLEESPWLLGLGVIFDRGVVATVLGVAGRRSTTPWAWLHLSPFLQ